MPSKKTGLLSEFLIGLLNMSRVVTAIILRETKTRFGKNKLGYLWAFIEPAAYVVILILIRKYMNSRIPFGTNLYLFILTGVLVYRVFISIAGRATGAISSNQALLTYPIVKPLDTILARVILESLTMVTILSTFFIILELFSEHALINYPDELVLAIFATLLLSAGVGFFNAVMVMIIPVWERIWGLSKLPLLLLSGVFYIPKSMPPVVQKIIAWNPVTNCIEWFRFGSYLDYDPMLSRSYVIWFGLICMLIGLIAEKIYRNELVRA